MHRHGLFALAAVEEQIDAAFEHERELVGVGMPFLVAPRLGVAEHRQDLPAVELGSGEI